MKQYTVLDLTYTIEEGQECFTGSYEECESFINSQGSPISTFKITMNENYFSILTSAENPDGSLILTAEMSTELRDLLISKGFNAVIKESLDQIETGELK